MEPPTDGILLVDKAEGETSYAVVRKVKSALADLKVQKVGHAGTLDPFATGLLIILLGQGTKLSPFLMSDSKIYQATMSLGIETDTLDCTGKVVRTSAVPALSAEYIKEKAQGFVGDIEQTPPIYSAVKYRGTRAYKLARAGREVELKKRKVTVHSLRIDFIGLPDVVMEVECSSGTYIRSLAADLGSELGPGGHLKSLRRLASGFFKAQNALSSEDISSERKHFILLDRLIPLRAALPRMLEIEVGYSLAEKVRHGYQPVVEDFLKTLNVSGFDNGYIKLVSDGRLVAIVKANRNGGRGHDSLKIERVFF